ncbi:hypothetical protein CYMTET_33569 [Cymbomonas tetramitiformis]|uniref:Uncharacterized protein n=1 Tax=Cymbomonas tetramitiformis TaxID=36881 RepID=A0AAE0FCW9_9CHLO|nr:hypothetical protein CYMTET_33569 [Cymbomonas tetramitiformis]
MAVAPQSDETEMLVDLMDMESAAYMYIDGVTTVTFFHGEVPLEQLKTRLVNVVQASPWLAGKLVKNKKAKGVQMAFSPSPTAEKVIADLVEEIELDISPSMPFETMMDTVKTKTTAHIKETGFELLKKKLPYTRLTVAKNSNNTQGWALIFSISHTIADGFTYYKVLGMLSRREEIVSLNATRNHSFVPKLKEAVGPKEYATFMGSASLMMNFLCTMMFGPKPRARAFYLDLDKLKTAKEKVKQEIDQKVPAGADSDANLNFVSTNDIVTAFWGRFTGARLCEMAVNFRNRFPELRKTDAGNYEGCILFSDADFSDARGFAHGPASIRSALQRQDGKFRSTLDPPRPLPGFFEMSRCKYRIITNWASFFSELEFDGCTQTLHIPYLAPSSIPTDLLVIFRPTRSTLGAFIITRKLSDEALTSGDSLLSKHILPPLVK